jgi:Flp pilus assembly protein TadB
MDSGKAILMRAFRRLEQEVPERVARIIRGLRHPRARWIRIPVAVALVVGGIFSILPVLGLWMLPLGLLLIAYDVPWLRRPVGRFTLWGTRKWVSHRKRLFPGSRDCP